MTFSTFKVGITELNSKTLTTRHMRNFFHAIKSNFRYFKITWNNFARAIFDVPTTRPQLVPQCQKRSHRYYKRFQGKYTKKVLKF